MVDNKRLDELMLEKYPHIVYTAEQSDEFLKKYEGDLTDEDAVAQDFVEYVTYRKNFAVMSTKKLTALLKTASEDDAKIISALIKARQDAIRSFEDKFELYVVESYIDGRCKVARNTKKFSWKDILKMKVKDAFKPMGYKSICNFFGIEIEVSNCGSMVRYRIGENGAVSEWKEIYYTKGGRPFFEVSKKAHGCTRYYLDEFMKI